MRSGQGEAPSLKACYESLQHSCSHRQLTDAMHGLYLISGWGHSDVSHWFLGGGSFWWLQRGGQQLQATIFVSQVNHTPDFRPGKYQNGRILFFTTLRGNCYFHGWRHVNMESWRNSEFYCLTLTDAGPLTWECVDRKQRICMEKYYSASHTFPTVTTQSAVSTECVYEMCKYMIKHINMSIESKIKDGAQNRQ